MTTQLALADLDDPPGPRAELVDPATTIAFMLAGNAHVTFQSRRTGARFTYRVRSAPGWSDRAKAGEPRSSGPSHFVSVLVGPDNGGSYSYLGCVFEGRAYAHGKKSHIDREAPSAVAFAWVWRTLSGGKMHPELAVYHEGRCGRCGRRLTDPSSILSGMGASCREKSGV